MSDIIFIKLASAILLAVFVYTFAFWFGYEKGVADTKSRPHKENQDLLSAEDEFLQEFTPPARTLYEQIMGGACKDSRSTKGKGSFTATLSPKMEFLYDQDKR